MLKVKLRYVYVIIIIKGEQKVNYKRNYIYIYSSEEVVLIRGLVFVQIYNYCSS